MNRTADPARLDAEISALRQRLDEAEDMRRAITSGEVDAFVVGQGDESKRVLLLAGAYQRYRQVVERMHQGAVTVSVSGDVLFANQRFADMLGVPISRLFAAPLEAYVTVQDRARLSSFLLVAARSSAVETVFSRQDGTQFPARVALASFSDGYLTLIITDLEPLRRLAAACEQIGTARGAIDALGRAAGLDAAGRKAAETLGADLARVCAQLEGLLEGASAIAVQPASESPSPVRQ
jgi:PAS domain S-box-containing protein